MRIKRIGAAITIAAALTAASAGPAAAQTPGACVAVLTAADVGATGSCSFESGAAWALVNVVTDGSLTGTLRCTVNGSTGTTTRSYTGPGHVSWLLRGRGACTLTLTSTFPGTTATATASPIVVPLRP